MTARATFLAVLLVVTAGAQSRPAPAQTASWAQQVASFRLQMMSGHGSAALATAKQMCVIHPTWPLAFSFRAVAEAKVGDWGAARADIATARSQKLLPQFRWVWAVALMHSPRPADHVRAIRVARAALAAPRLSPFAQLGAESVLAAMLQPEPFLAQLQGQPPLSKVRQWGAVSAYSAHLMAKGQWDDAPLFVWGPSRGVPRLAARPAANRLPVWFAQAQRALGDSAELEADWVFWLVHQHQLLAAYRRWRSAAGTFPHDPLLASAGARLQLAGAQGQFVLGYPRRALQLLSSPPVTNAVGLVWRARALAELGQYSAAQALLAEAALRRETPEGSPVLSPTALLQAAHKDIFAATLGAVPGDSSILRGEGPYFWQGRIAFAAGDYATAAAALQASPALKVGLHPLAKAMLGISLARSGHPHQAAEVWAQIQDATGQGLSPVYLRLRRGRPVPGTVGVQGELTAVLCRQGRPIGVNIQDGLLSFPLRFARRPSHVPSRCGPLATPQWGVAKVIANGALLPDFIGTLRRWLPSGDF
ncbi:MAG: hypothetical protein ACRD2E_13420 [Terriglobales bacterium]